MKKNNLWEYLKYLLVAGLCFVIDITAFSILDGLLQDSHGETAIIISTVIARIVSSFVNYLLNSRFVFKTYDKWSIIKYYALVIIQMFVSAFSVYTISNYTKINDTIIKFAVDVCIFIANYIIQKKIVFRGE